MLAEKRQNFKKLENMVGTLFYKFLTPNQYSYLAIFISLIGFKFLIELKLKTALVLLATASFLDFVDGAVARKTETASKKGAYLDTILDRYVEGIILLGFLFLPLPQILFPNYIWIFLALFGSLMTTYAKAAGKEKGILEIELKKGLIGRGERMILENLAIFLGIFNLQYTIYLIIALAVLSNLTAIQRIFLVLNQK
ncbi:MAG: CDP-alcohol phosphatidyltransferase family protein [Patescibacteria group bacterium]